MYQKNFYTRIIMTEIRKTITTRPLPPTGYESRVTNTDPRVASDNSAYEERVYQAVTKDEGGFTGNPVDTNLYGRVKEVRNVATTQGHLISDYPGESPWFIKSSFGVDNGAYIELTIADDGEENTYKAVKFVANPEGEYRNSLQICYDGATWVPVVLGTEYTPTGTGEYAGKVWVRGRINHNGGVCPKFGGNADAITAVSGDLSFLLDYRATSVVAPKYRAFAHMFEGCTALTTASSLVFPSGKSGISAYMQMFDGCTALATAPNLSHVQLSNNIFYGMFRGCAVLTTAPALPAVDVVPLQAYMEMFKGCTHLSSITVHIGDHIVDNALIDWMDGAGTEVNGTCTFNHSGNFRWRYPSKSGIPGSAQDNQKEWTPVPEITTRFVFSVQGQGTLVGVKFADAESELIYFNSGDFVEKGYIVGLGAIPADGWAFDHWEVKPSAGTWTESQQGAVAGLSTTSFPYKRSDTDWEQDKFEAVAVFRDARNLSVSYTLGGTSSDLAFVRYTAGDTTKDGNKMFAWTPGDTNNTTLMTGIGILYTATVSPEAGSKLYKVDAAGNWFESTGTIRSGVWTDDFTVIFFDNATSYVDSLKVECNGRTYRNDYMSFCALTAPANSSVTITVYQEDHTSLVAAADLHWSDNVTDNPRTVTVLAANKGICLSRDAN